jgi:hypothetical protein
MTVISVLSRVFAALAAGGVSLLAASAAMATVYSVSLDHTMFGNLDQNDVPACKDEEGNSFACGPTAAVNSFVWLQNRYPHVYDSKLIPEQDLDLNEDGEVNFYDHMIAVAIELSKPEYMDCAACQGGTAISTFISGKQQYIEDQIPGVTEYAFQNMFDPNSEHPTWQFLYNELRGEEDVELLIGFYDEQNERIGGHYVTLTTFHLDDGNNDGLIDQDEGAFIEFIDPFGGLLGMADIFQVLVGGLIGISSYFIAGDVTLALIEAAVKESPIPEPGLVLLFGAGAFWLARRRLRA